MKKVYIYLTVFITCLLIAFTILDKNALYLMQLPVAFVALYYSYTLKLFDPITEITGRVVLMKFLTIILLAMIIGFSIARFFFIS